MKKGSFKKFLQRLAVVLAVVLAFPQGSIAGDFGLGWVRAHADEKVDPGFYIYIDREKIITDTVTITPGFMVEEPVPTGTIRYEYSTSPVVYTDEGYIDYEKMTWTEITKTASVTSPFVWDVPKGVLGKQLTIYGTYSGDNTYKSDTDYDDLSVSVVKEITQVSKSTEAATSGKYTFDMYFDLNGISDVLMEVGPQYYIKISQYNATGYESTKPIDLVKEENCVENYDFIDENSAENVGSYYKYIYEETANEDRLVPSGIRFFIDSNLTEDLYVFQLVGVYNGVLSEKIVTAPFITGNNVLDAKDLEAKAEDNVMEIDGIQQTPKIVLSARSGETTSSSGENTSSSGENTSSSGETTGTARKALVEKWISYAEDYDDISYYFVQKYDRKGEIISSDPAVTSAAVSVAGIYGIYAVSTGSAITISPVELGTMLVEQAPPSDKPKIHFSVSADKETYIATVNTTKIENATADKTIEYSFDGEKSFSGESTCTAKPGENIRVGVRFAKGGEIIPASDPVVTEVTAPGRSAEPEFEKIEVEGKQGIRIKANNSSIYYTKDGTDPVIIQSGTQNSTVVSPAVSGTALNVVDIFPENNVSSLTVKALAVEDGKVRSSVVSATLKITQNNDENNSLVVTTIEIPVTGLELNWDGGNIAGNSVKGITAVISPSYAADRSIQWTVENAVSGSNVDAEDIVSLSNKFSDSGDVVTIKGLKAGMVNITAAACDNVNISKTITVTVTEAHNWKFNKFKWNKKLSNATGTFTCEECKVKKSALVQMKVTTLGAGENAITAFTAVIENDPDGIVLRTPVTETKYVKADGTETTKQEYEKLESGAIEDYDDSAWNLFYIKEDGYTISLPDVNLLDKDGKLGDNTGKSKNYYKVEAVTKTKKGKTTLKGLKITVISTDAKTRKNASKQNNSRITLPIYNDSGEKIGEYNLRLPVYYQKPTLSLSSKTGTIYTQEKKKDETVKRQANYTVVSEKKSTGIYEPLNIGNQRKKVDFWEPIKDLGNTKIISTKNKGELKITANDKASGKIVIWQDNWCEPVRIKYSLKVEKKNTITVSKKKIKMNSNAYKTGEEQIVTVLLNGRKITAKDKVLVDFEMKSGIIVEGIEKIDGKTFLTGSELKIKYDPKKSPEKGSITLEFQKENKGSNKCSLKINVSTTELKKAVTVKIKSKLNLITGQNMVIIPTLKDIGGEITSVSLPENEKIFKVISYNPETNQIIVGLKKGVDIENIKDKYTRTFNITVSGTTCPIEIKNFKIESKKPTVTITDVTLPESKFKDGKAEGYADLLCTYKSGKKKFSIAPTNVEFIKNCENNSELGDGWYTYIYKNIGYYVKYDSESGKFIVRSAQGYEQKKTTIKVKIEFKYNGFSVIVKKSLKIKIDKNS